MMIIRWWWWWWWWWWWKQGHALYYCELETSNCARNHSSKSDCVVKSLQKSKSFILQTDNQSWFQSVISYLFLCFINHYALQCSDYPCFCIAGCSLHAVLILLLHWMHWLQVVSMQSFFRCIGSKLSCCCNQITIETDRIHRRRYCRASKKRNEKCWFIKSEINKQ